MQDISGSIILDGNLMNARMLTRNIRSSLLVNPLREIFSCLICRSLVTPPVMVSLCCKQIIGCKICVEMLPTERCPHCRAENVAYIEMNIFDTTLTALAEVVTDD